ncbi:MAG: dockerin type I repeat-containing protein [Porcipelethomonas sp.]
MKKLISGIMSAMILASLAAASTAAVCAETVVEETPAYPMYGTRCGTVIVQADIDRDVYITIDQVTDQDGTYRYYDSVLIPASESETEHHFILEGNDQACYTITIGVPKYKGSSSLQEFSTSFMVYDTDEIDEGDVNGYEYTYSVSASEDDQLTSEAVPSTKGDDDILRFLTNIYFPVSDSLGGDANGDGVVNVRDAAFIAQKLAQGKSAELTDSADYNGDGTINVRDAAAIAKFLATGK